MKTIKELADIGAVAAFADNRRYHYMSVSKQSHSWESDEPARQAFAAAVRDAVLAELETKQISGTFEAHGLTWNRHTPGDPMPCDGDAKIVYIMRDYGTCSAAVGMLRWTAATKDESRDADIIGWRYADKPTTKTIPLDYTDIRATDEFRCKELHIIETAQFWHSDAVELSYGLPQRYADLAANYLRRQHGSNEWKPCTKEVTV